MNSKKFCEYYEKLQEFDAYWRVRKHFPQDMGLEAWKEELEAFAELHSWGTEHE